MPLMNFDKKYQFIYKKDGIHNLSFSRKKRVLFPLACAILQVSQF